MAQDTYALQWYEYRTGAKLNRVLSTTVLTSPSNLKKSMKNISRRSYLSALLATSVTAGCLEGERPLGLREVELLNLTDTEKEISIAISKDGSEIYNRSHTVSPPPGDSRYTITSSEFGERVGYSLTASTAINGNEASATSNSESFVGDYSETSCFKAVVIVESGELNIAHSYFESCETES